MKSSEMLMSCPGVCLALPSSKEYHFAIYVSTASEGEDPQRGRLLGWAEKDPDTRQAGEDCSPGNRGLPLSRVWAERPWAFWSGAGHDLSAVSRAQAR